MASKPCVRCHLGQDYHYINAQCPYYVAPAGLFTRLTGAILTRLWYTVMNGSDRDRQGPPTQGAP